MRTTALGGIGSNGSEAVGRLEVLSAKATATFSEPNLKLD